MQRSFLIGYAGIAIALTALLTGCAASQAPIGAPDAVIDTFDTGPMNIAVYANVTGKAHDYEDYGPFYDLADCAYDGSGNLFVTGYSATLGELPKGASTFTNSALSLKSDHSELSGHGTLLDRIAMASSDAKVVSRTKLSGGDVKFKWLYDGAAIGIEAPRRNAIAFWNYPHGGKPTHVLKGYGSGFNSATISVAP